MLLGGKHLARQIRREAEALPVSLRVPDEPVHEHCEDLPLHEHLREGMPNSPQSSV